MTRRLRFLVVLAIAVLVLAAGAGCASRGSTSDLASASGATVDRDDASDDGSSDRGAGDDGATDDASGSGDDGAGGDDRGAAEDGDDEGGGATGGGGDDGALGDAGAGFDADPGSALCQYLGAVDLDELELDVSADPAAVEAGVRRLIDTMSGARDVAPEELAADFDVLVAGLVELDALLAEAGYDTQVLAERDDAQAVVDVVTDPEFTAANDRVTAYRAEACGL